MHHFCRWSGVDVLQFDPLVCIVLFDVSICLFAYLALFVCMLVCPSVFFFLWTFILFLVCSFVCLFCCLFLCKIDWMHESWMTYHSVKRSCSNPQTILLLDIKQARWSSTWTQTAKKDTKCVWVRLQTATLQSLHIISMRISKSSKVRSPFLAFRSMWISFSFSRVLQQLTSRPRILIAGCGNSRLANAARLPKALGILNRLSLSPTSQDGRGVFIESKPPKKLVNIPESLFNRLL